MVDPVAFKRENALTFGATHVFADAAQAQEAVIDLTRGQLADHALITIGVLNSEVVDQAAAIVGKGCQVTITSVGRSAEKQIQLAANGSVVGWQRRIQGHVFGMCNPLNDIPRLLRLYRAGQLKLDELITRRYTLDDDQPGLPGPGRRQDHPRRHHPRGLAESAGRPAPGWRSSATNRADRGSSGLTCRPMTTIATRRAPASLSATAADCALPPDTQVSSTTSTSAPATVPSTRSQPGSTPRREPPPRARPRGPRAERRRTTGRGRQRMTARAAPAARHDGGEPPGPPPSRPRSTATLRDP